MLQEQLCVIFTLVRFVVLLHLMEALFVRSINVQLMVVHQFARNHLKCVNFIVVRNLLALVKQYQMEFASHTLVGFTTVYLSQLMAALFVLSMCVLFATLTKNHIFFMRANFVNAKTDLVAKL
jgi:hypothetical protein